MKIENERSKYCESKAPHQLLSVCRTGEVRNFRIEHIRLHRRRRQHFISGIRSRSFSFPFTVSRCRCWSRWFNFCRESLTFSPMQVPFARISVRASPRDDDDGSASDRRTCAHSANALKKVKSRKKKTNTRIARNGMSEDVLTRVSIVVHCRTLVVRVSIAAMLCTLTVIYY